MLSVEDPATEEVLWRFADSPAAVVDAAVSSAAAAGVQWATRDPVDRGRVLFKIAAQIRAEADALAILETLDTGKPLAQSRGDVETAARYFEFYAGAADKHYGAALPAENGTWAYTRREPYGVVAHITPWNSPISQMSRGVAPCLAVGNTVVVKPSELTPLSTLVSARLMADAGLPPGVCNVVAGLGSTTGARLAGHPGVRHITFTGSVPTGRLVAAAAARRIVGCNLELGGKSATIVLPDADLAKAALAGARAVVRNSGQSCFATTRLIVHRSIAQEFTDLVVRHVSGLRTGHGLDDPDIGPLASAQQLEKVLGYLDSARSEGAGVAVGGDRLGSTGHFLSPAVLTGVRNDMRVAREEIFGPVQSILVYDTEPEAIAMANDSEYGLAAGLFTRDLSAAHRIAAALEAGQVQVNQYPIARIDTPFGGYKNSGLGREKGLEALDHYSQTKTVIIAG